MTEGNNINDNNMMCFFYRVTAHGSFFVQKQLRPPGHIAGYCSVQESHKWHALNLEYAGRP
jgi:hypothetical protein